MRPSWQGGEGGGGGEGAADARERQIERLEVAQITCGADMTEAEMGSRGWIERRRGGRQAGAAACRSEVCLKANSGWRANKKDFCGAAKRRASQRQLLERRAGLPDREGKRAAEAGA